MKALSALMENATLYRLWQSPFAEKKLAPLLARSDIAAARSVLDLGCGPGTNTPHFSAADYLGVDLNADYVAYARRRFGRLFVAADVRDYRPAADRRFDFILINSLLHHVDDAGTHEILSSVARLLTPDGHVHILDLILPARAGLARSLALWDRGAHPRALPDWERIFREHFEPVVVEPYRLGLLGTTLWNMVYFKGRRRE